MARKKVNLAWIANDVVRRTTFKRRRHGLIKKVSELSVLCGVSACVVIYGPHEAQPEVWPSESEARNILQHFRGLPVMEQEKKMLNQEAFLQQRVKKMFEQSHRMEREIRESEMSVLMNEGMVDDRILQDVGVGDATSLLYFIDMKLREVYDAMKAAKAQMMGVEAARKELFFHNMHPANIAAQSKLPVYESRSVGLPFEMMQPYVSPEGQWIGPTFFNF